MAIKSKTECADTVNINFAMVINSKTYTRERFLYVIQHVLTDPCAKPPPRMTGGLPESWDPPSIRYMGQTGLDCSLAMKVGNQGLVNGEVVTLLSQRGLLHMEARTPTDITHM